MLIDTHCHIDAYPQPALALAAGQAGGTRTIAVTTSLASYVRTRVLCRHHPRTHVALGLHPRRSGTGYDQWSEWREMLEGVPLIGEVGLDFGSGKEENWATQTQALAEIAQACAGDRRLLMVHSDHAEAEVWDIVTAQQVKWVIWHGYRPDGPKSLLYRAIEAGHFMGVGPDAVRDGAMRSRLRAVPREQIVTETNGPWSRLGTGDRAAALREILATLADTWRCTPQEAEAQVERNYARIMAGLGISVDSCAQDADRAV